MDILAAVLVPPGTCLNISGMDSSPTSRGGWDVDSVPQAAPPRPFGWLRPGMRPLNSAGGGPNTNAWFYQACTQIVHPIGSNGVTDLFWHAPWQIADLTAECGRLFNVVPNPTWLPATMGMWDVPRLARSASRIIFSNGLLDPWSTHSVLHSLSDSLVVLNLTNGSHHSDLGAPPNPRPSSDDSDELRAVRAEETRLLRMWLAAAWQERTRQEV